MKMLKLCLAAMFLTCCVLWCDAKEPANSDGTNSTARTAMLSLEDFTRIASTPGDATPLMAQLAKVNKLWSNVTVAVNMKFQDGRTFDETVAGTAKTINGKYIVTTVESKLNHQKITAISTFDEKASAYKTWSLFGNVVAEETDVYDFDKKIYASSAIYGGLVEIGVGSYSATAESSKTFVYKNGVLFMTRELKVTPVEK